MALLDDLLKQAGGVAEFAQKNPQAVAAVLALLSSRNSSVGGSGGLGGLVGQFQKAGLGDMMSSWISTGPNPPISAQQVSQVLGNDTLAEFASQAGLGHAQASSALAMLLPAVIDHLTPQGEIPHPTQLEGTLGSLLSQFAR
jgi:uncharacterized protein YidB (DUF937 family)